MTTERKERKIISDLETVDLSSPVYFQTYKEGTVDEFTVHYIVQDNYEYRVPHIVMLKIKKILEIKPEVKKVKVIREKNGANVSYDVIPM